MESLPTELLQEILWDALNPSLYLVSKTIGSRLPPFRDFEHDLILLLFCDRVAPNSPWVDVPCLPWQTARASQSDPRLSVTERTGIQRHVLNSPWFTLPKFKFAAKTLCELWLKKHWSVLDMLLEEQTRLQDLLNTKTFPAISAWFQDQYGNQLRIRNASRMTVSPAGCIKGRYSRSITDVLYIPRKLLLPLRTPEKFDLIFLLRMCTEPTSGEQRLFFPSSLLKDAVHSTIINQDEPWFMLLYGITRSYSFDIDVAQLDNETATCAIRGRKWRIVKEIITGIRFPEDLFTEQLAPHLEEAIKEGDAAAKDLMQWIRAVGWGKIRFMEFSQFW